MKCIAKTGIPAVFIDIGPDGVRIAESLKADGGMSIAHKADGDESEAFRGVEIFECVFISTIAELVPR